MSASREPTRRFTDRVEPYVRHRPSYPDAAVDHVLAELGLDEGATVADLGAGTGIFSRLLLDRGLRVVAVEPNEAMREAADSRLESRSGYASRAGTAEATGLPDGAVDGITAAQAFHWFRPADTRAEVRRILRPGRGMALLWNTRRLDSDFARGYEEILQRHGTDYREVDHRRVASPEVLDAFFGRGRWSVARFPNAQHLDREALRGRVLSASYTPGPGDQRHAPMLEALDLLFERDASGGVVVLGYDTEVYCGSPGG